MSRVLVLTADLEDANRFGAHLIAVGGVSVGQTGPTVTVVLPSLGRVTVSCIVIGDRDERVVPYLDAVAVIVMAGGTGDASLVALGPLMDAARQHWSELTTVVGIGAEVTGDVIGRVGAALNPRAVVVPVCHVDVEKRSDVLVLLATALSMAYERGFPG